MSTTTKIVLLAIAMIAIVAAVNIITSPSTSSSTQASNDGSQLVAFHPDDSARFIIGYLGISGPADNNLPVDAKCNAIRDDVLNHPNYTAYDVARSLSRYGMKSYADVAMTVGAYTKPDAVRASTYASDCALGYYATQAVINAKFAKAGANAN